MSERCPKCGGPIETRGGTVLLMGKESLQNLDKLAEVAPDLALPTGEGDFRVCSSGCEWREQIR